MARNVSKLTFHGAAFLKLLRGDQGIAPELIRRGGAIAAAAGDGVGIRVSRGGARMRVTVATESLDAVKAEATDKTLTRALGAGRG
jgi:hypothetical protein